MDRPLQVGRRERLTSVIVLLLNASMDTTEVAELDRRLRQFAAQHEMTWVVEELDNAIATGVFERRELRQTSRKGETIYDDVPKSQVGGRRRAEEFVGRRPMTPEEQAVLMLNGLRRVLADLDEIAIASVEQLNDLASVTQSSSDIDGTEHGQTATRPLPTVTEIDFAPDEGDPAPGVSTEGLRYSESRIHVAAVLRRAETEVAS